MILFGVRGKMRTLDAGRTQTNIISARKREHSRKPDELYSIIQACSPEPYLELFARGRREGWDVWGNESEEYMPSWSTYPYNSTVSVCIEQHPDQMKLFENDKINDESK